MRTTPLHSDFGVDVHDVQLRDVMANRGYPEIRDLFERHSLLLFRNQDLNDDAHLSLARLFGPLENRSTVEMDEPVLTTSKVSNVSDDGGVYDAAHTRLLDLKSNMLWHTDSTFLPVPALANILRADVVADAGGATEFVSTRAAFARFDRSIQERLRGLSFHHRYSHSRARIDPSLAEQDKFTMWPDTRWRAVWTNPTTGEDALYIASHAFAVAEMDDADGAAFLDWLIEQATRPEDIYTHAWTVGDVLIWDERATLHRGTPWPFDQPRALSSLCVSVSDEDGLSAMRVA